MNIRMKRYLILGIGLFLIESLLFCGVSTLIGLGMREMLMFGSIYFFILLFYHHYKFIPVLIWQEIVQMLHAHALYLVLCTIIGLYLNTSVLAQIILLTGIMYCVVVLGGRAYRICTKQKLGTSVIVLGAGSAAEKINELFDSNRFMYVNPIAFVNLETLTNVPVSKEIADNKRVISMEEMFEFIDNNWIDEVFIVDENLTSEQLESIVNKLNKKVPVIRYKPKMNVIQPYNTDIVDFDGDIFVSITDGKRRYLDVVLKKIIDIVSGIAGCLLLLPFTVFVKLKSLKNGDHEPIFFTQDRVGEDGKIFKMYKYRSMVPNAEQLLEEMMEKDPKIREEYLTNKKLDPDPRITPFGEFLRKTSLDEFPQFINVLKGDMSLIGPRPYLPREIEDMGKSYETVIKSKPGITGIWQVSGRSDIAFHRRCKLDEYYYNNWSIWLDMIIIVKTIKVVLRRDGAL